MQPLPYHAATCHKWTDTWTPTSRRGKDNKRARVGLPSEGKFKSFRHLRRHAGSSRSCLRQPAQIRRQRLARTANPAHLHAHPDRRRDGQAHPDNRTARGAGRSRPGGPRPIRCAHRRAPDPGSIGSGLDRPRARRPRSRRPRRNRPRQHRRKNVGHRHRRRPVTRPHPRRPGPARAPRRQPARQRRPLQPHRRLGKSRNGLRRRRVVHHRHQQRAARARVGSDIPVRTLHAPGGKSQQQPRRRARTIHRHLGRQRPPRSPRRRSPPRWRNENLGQTPQNDRGHLNR